MPQYRTFQTTFTSGEFDQKLRDRTDIRAFFEGAQKMRNFALLSQGGFTRRPGSFLLAEVQPGRIIPFEYSATDALILNLYDGGVEIWFLNGASGGSITGAPWTYDQLFEIKYVQRGNGVILVHKEFKPQFLLRDPSTGNFTLEDLEFSTDGNGLSLQPTSRIRYGNQIQFSVSSLGSGTRTMTSTEDYFQAAHVGSVVELEGGYAVITGYNNAKSVSINQTKPPERFTINDPLQTTDGSNKVLVTLAAHSFSVGQVIDMNEFIGVGGLTAANINGNRTIDQVIDANTFRITAGGTATDTETGGGSLGRIEFTGPTPFLKEQSFSPVNGYPGAVCIHEERLWFGGTVAQPAGLWGSVVTEFDNFDIGDGEPADAIQVTIDSGQVNEIRHLVSSRHLQVLTNENEFYVPSTDQAPLTPETFVIRKQTPFGSSQVRASLFDGATIFTQESGRSVREFLYTDREFAYNARNIALLAQHLIETPKDLQTVYGGTIRPEQYAFLLNSTGTIAVLHAIRSEEIVGWAQWETQGFFEGIAVVGQRVFVTNYHQDQDDKLYLEELDFTFQYFMDGIVGFDSTGTPTNTWGPVLEYANSEVAVTTGPYFLGYTNVDGNGFFTTPDEYEQVECGINFLAFAETMQTAFQLPDGPMTGMPIRLTRAIVDFGDSASIYVDGQRLILRDTTDFPPDVPERADRKDEFWINVISRKPSVEFYSEFPLESTVYSIMIEVAF